MNSWNIFKLNIINNHSETRIKQCPLYCQNISSQATRQFILFVILHLRGNYVSVYKDLHSNRILLVLMLFVVER